MTMIVEPNSVSITISNECIEKLVAILLKSNISFSYQPSLIALETDNHQVFSSTDNKKVNIIDLKQLDILIAKYLQSGLLPNLAEIAKKMSMKETAFKHKFKEQYQQPFYQYYLEKKMGYAASLLKGGKNATEVSNHIGYSHPIKFNKMFQKHFGITPKKYQMHMLKK